MFLALPAGQTGPTVTPSLWVIFSVNRSESIEKVTKYFSHYITVRHLLVGFTYFFVIAQVFNLMF